MNKETFDRRRIRMSLEGWYYAFVLAFIGSAAILRRANLLLILAAMLTAPILFNWRFVMSSLRRLIVKRVLPRLAVAGKVFRVGLTLGNSASMDSWHVQIDETIEVEGNQDSVSVAVIFDRVPFQNRTTRTYECLLHQRGVYTFRHSVISTSYPIGLVRAFAQIENEERIFVGPALGKLSNVWLQWAQPDQVDEPRSIGRKGILDGLFYSVREFRHGDSRRSIHWRSTAKLGKPAVKQYEKQSDRELNLVVDLFGEQGESTQENNRAEILLSFVATLLDQVCSIGRCEINLLIVGNRHVVHRGHATQAFLEDVNCSLAEMDPDHRIDTSLSIERFLAAETHQSPLVVVSTRPTIHQGCTPIQHDLPFPSYALATSENAELPCCWIDVNEEAFGKIFEPPEQLAEVRPLATEKV